MVQENPRSSGRVGQALGTFPCAISHVGRQEEVMETTLECGGLGVWLSHWYAEKLLSAARPSLVYSVLRTVGSSY